MHPGFISYITFSKPFSIKILAQLIWGSRANHEYFAKFYN